MFDEAEKVPQIDAIGIDFPGFVRNIDSALQLLGGTQGIHKVYHSASNALLPLHFRPDDVTSHPIFGEKHPARGLLVKVARKAGGGSVEGQIVARVSSMYRFPGVADFQFVADTSLPAQDEGPMAEKLEGPYGAAAEPLLAVPPLFTRVDMPMEYQFRSFYGEDPPAFRGAGGAKSKGQLPPYVLKAICLSVPPAVALPELVEGSFKPEKRELLKRLHALFLERPIWSSLALLDRLQELKVALNELEGTLPRLAYTFRSGPFRFLWMRRGFDPRVVPDSRNLQAISYVLPRAWFERFQARAEHDHDGEDQADAMALPDIATSYSELKGFKAVPKQQALLQVCDIVDASISSMLQRNQPQAEYDADSGWFTEAQLTSIRDRVTARFQALLDAVAGQDSGEQPADQDHDALETTVRKSGQDTDAAEQQAEQVGAAPEPEQGEQPAAGKHSIVPDGIMDALLVDWVPGKPAHEGLQQPDLASPPPQDDAREEAAAADATALQEEFEVFEDESEMDDGFDEAEDDEEDEEDEEDEDEDEDDVMENDEA